MIINMSLSLYPIISLILFYLLFTLSTLLSSINTIHSSYQLFLWAVYGCIFVFALQRSMALKYFTLLIYVIFILSAALFIGHLVNPSYFHFLSPSPYQFVLPSWGDHNHLGDLAGLVCTLLLLSPPHLLIGIPFFLFAFVIMAVSFSKSAFLGFIIAVFVLGLKKKGIFRLYLLTAALLSLFIVAIYTKELSSIPPIATIQKVMTHSLKLSPKPLLSVRDIYYPQVFRAWKSAPLEQILFGVGPGNYIYSSVKTGVSSDLTPTETHNIEMGIIVENGALACLWFCLFCCLIIFIGIKNNNPYSYVFIFLLTNFQTDYSYAIPFFMILTFFAAGQSIRFKPHISIIIAVLLIALSSGIYHLYLQRYKTVLDSQLALSWKKMDKQKVSLIIMQLEQITPFEEGELIKWSSIQESMQNLPEAVRLLEKLMTYSPRWYILQLPHQFEMQQKLEVPLKNYILQKRSMYTQFPFSDAERIAFNEVCAKYANIPCIE